MPTRTKPYGEGNYEATRRYNEATRRFVESGRVERAARAAAPETPAVAADLARAEQAALLRARKAPDGTVDDRMDPASSDPRRASNAR